MKPHIFFKDGYWYVRWGRGTRCDMRDWWAAEMHADKLNLIIWSDI